MANQQPNKPRGAGRPDPGSAQPRTEAATGEAAGGRSARKAPSRQAKDAAGEATPSMAQYLEIKTANPDSLLWYRMGDFYELFFADAVVAAEALGIALTKRGKHLGEDIPMCGVPVSRADEYLHRLIRRGYRVAVCEQLEDPAEARKRGSKAVVRRDVVRLVTPGTLTEDSLLDARARNYLTALFVVPEGSLEHTNKRAYALASLELSTGECEVGTVEGADLGGELVRLGPSELIATEETLTAPDVASWLTHLQTAATPVAATSFDSTAGSHNLKAALGVADLAAYGGFSRPELAAVAALLQYVDLTQIGQRPLLRPPRRIGAGSILMIDAASRASLEIIRSSAGERSGSLLWAIDRTVTGAGARELTARLSSPLTDPSQIKARLDAVAFLIDHEPARDELRAHLKAAPDIARALSRLSLQRGGPRDLAAVGTAMRLAAACASQLDASTQAIGLPQALAAMVAGMRAPPAELATTLAAAVVEDPPQLKRDGGFVRPGYRAELDEARRLGDDSRKVLAALEARYSEQTGIRSLKIRYNNILGYFIEVTQANAKPLMSSPLADTFRHRQTMANAVRFTTAELSETEGQIATASERALAIEQEIFGELAAAVDAAAKALATAAAALAEIDVCAALAAVAVEQGYVRPDIDTDRVLEIRGGRHPVVEQALASALAGPFIENDCVLAGAARGELAPAADGADAQAQGRVWLVTGPNMAGKSTFLRQNALIVLLAQCGSFVPARSARIGVVDRLFSRVGASDDLARGRSTFMVEMVETAAILNQAGERSLVILDEIGRGTATFDGLSIAWATLEYLHDVCKARALFATHYHELTQLAERLSMLSCVCMEVREWRDEIVFLHRVQAGAADRSYGIQVAKLAGLPLQVVARAGEVLRRLEREGSHTADIGGALEQLPLFAAASRLTMPDDRNVAAAPSEPSRVVDLIDSTNADELTPKAALDLIYRLKQVRREDVEAAPQGNGGGPGPEQQR